VAPVNTWQYQLLARFLVRRRRARGHAKAIIDRTSAVIDAYLKQPT
jgi:hypothetical protein